MVSRSPSRIGSPISTPSIRPATWRAFSVWRARPRGFANWSNVRSNCARARQGPMSPPKYLAEVANHGQCAAKLVWCTQEYLARTLEYRSTEWAHGRAGPGNLLRPRRHKHKLELMARNGSV